MSSAPEPPEELCDMAFECELMEDPVMASDGHTYNRRDIENWFKQHNTSPHTHEPFEDQVLRPNIAIRKLVIAWREKHGLPIPSFPAPPKKQASGGGGVKGFNPAHPQISKPAALCSFTRQPLQVFCITCDKAICGNCAMDSSRCKSHNTRPLATIVMSVRDVHTAWQQLLDGRPQHLLAECDRVDAAVAAAIQSICDEGAELKLQLQRACMDDVEGTLQEQAQLLADVEIAAASPEAAVAGSEACRCLRTVVTRRLRAPVRNAGVARFEPAAAAAATGRARNNRLGKIVGGRGLACGVGDVAANGAGFFSAFGRQGSANGQLSNPAFIVLDDEGNFVVSDSGNCRVQVFDSSNGTHLRTIGPQLAGVRQPGQGPPLEAGQSLFFQQVQPLWRAGGYCFSSPQGIALDGSGHLVVADNGSSCVHVLNYADGSYVSTIGNHYLGAPSGVAIDSDGNIVVHDGDNSGCIQIFRLSDGAHIRSIGDQQCYGGGSVAFDVEGNLVVACQRGVLVLDYSNGSVLRMISSLNQLQEVDNFGGLPFIRAPCQQLQPYGFAMDSAGHLVVSDSGSHSLHVLNYADGSLVRTIGGYGTRKGQFYQPRGVAIDGDGRIIVCDMSSHRIQVLQEEDDGKFDDEARAPPPAWEGQYD